MYFDASNLMHLFVSAICRTGIAFSQRPIVICNYLLVYLNNIMKTCGCLGNVVSFFVWVPCFSVIFLMTLFFHMNDI